MRTHKLKLTLLVGTLLVSMGCVLFIQYDWTTDKWVTYRDPGENPWGLKVSSAPFTPVLGSKTFLLNAFHEHRAAERSVRLLAIVWQEEKMLYHCILCCGDGQLVTMVAERTAHATNFWFPYGTGDFLCPVPEGCQPRFAGLVPELMDPANISVLTILNPMERRSDFPFNFTVCLSTMFNHYDNVLQFVQAMELYRLLGAQKVVVYKNSCSRAMQKVLDYYSKQVGLVEVLPWPVDSYIKVSSSWLMDESPGDLHYYGQIPALNDCVYRYMYQTQYLLLHDPDEVILPTGKETWAEMLSTLQSNHGDDVNFYFENNVFPIEETEESSSYNLPEWSHLPGVNFLLHLLREPIPAEHYTTGKFIVNPRTVLQMSVHTVEEGTQESSGVEVGPEVGQLYHMRRRKDTSLNKSDLVRDEGLLRFAPPLVREVNGALCHMALSKQSCSLYYV